MRSVPLTARIMIYFGTAPILIGEVIILFGLIAIMEAFPISLDNILGGCVLLLAGGYFVFRKIKILNRGVKSLSNGIKTEAVLTWIIDTNSEHNNRLIKEYIFEYYIDGQTFTYEYRSAYKRHLKRGDRMTIFYLENNPETSFIPKLYNVDI